MKPRIYLVTTYNTRSADTVAALLLQRGYAVYAPHLLSPLYSQSPEMHYATWLAHHKEWLMVCHALLCLKDTEDVSVGWAKELDLPIFYSLDTLIACIRIDASTVVASYPTETPAPAAPNPVLAANGAITTGTTSLTRSSSGRVSVPGRAGGLPMVAPNVLYDGEEWQCPGCERRFRTQSSIFDHVSVYHYGMLQGVNPLA